MEETDKINPEYIKGFNNGYIIAQYEPELAEKLSKIKAVSPHILGLQQGREQFLNEQIKDKRPSFLKENRTQIEKIDLNKKKNRDKGIEPEK